MKLAIATIAALGALAALAGPVFAEPSAASSYWERVRAQSKTESPPYALTGDSRRARDEGWTMRTEWVGGNRERRTIFERR